MFYSYANTEKEYVFCIKGRPFACLVSPFLPTPTATLIDFNLVRELGLKMTDLKCEKFSYSGFKMRILGKVSITCQCIHDGVSSGSFHIKANVVKDLEKNLDTECVAGNKMAAKLRGDSVPPSPAAASPAASSPSTPPRAAPSPAPSVPAAASPRTPPPRKHLSWMKTPPRSPPGFPSPLYAVSPGIPSIPVLHVSTTGQELSPRTANLNALSLAFNDADLKEDENLQMCAIMNIADGDMEQDDDGKLNYYLENGLHYQTGHGRALCSRVKCGNRAQYSVKDFPNNCGFHPKQWRLPDDFRPCDDDCLGGLCPCLSLYAPGYEVYLKQMRK